MLYLEYDKKTKQVVQIHEALPLIGEKYSYAISRDRKEINNGNEVTVNTFKLGDEFEYTIWINEVDENNNIVSHSSIRINPQAKRLLEENEMLKKRIEIQEDALVDIILGGM